MTLATISEHGLARADVKGLLDDIQGPCVSMYIPMQRGAPDSAQNRIRLQNAVREAEHRLAKRDDSPPDILRPLQDMLADHAFLTESAAAGLAAFAAPGMFRRHLLPIAVPERVVLGERFHVRPLLPLLTEDGRFHVLALSQGDVRLFEMSRFHAREIPLPEAPKSLDEAMGYDSKQQSIQWHGASTPSTGGQRPSPIFHGHGVGTDDEKDELRRFLQRVDEHVRVRIGDDGAPLVLAAVERVAAAYREVSPLANVLNEVALGSPDKMTPAQLHAHAWSVLEPTLEARTRKTVQAVQDAVGARKGVSGIEEVLPAAADGRVDVLLIGRTARSFGCFDAATRRLEIRASEGDEEEDLLDRAAAETLLHRGGVVTLDDDAVPGGRGVAAALRY